MVILSKFDEFHVQWFIYTEISVYILNGRESVYEWSRQWVFLVKLIGIAYNVCEKSLNVQKSTYMHFLWNEMHVLEDLS